MNKFRKTLIVDDDPTSRFLIRMTLEELNITQQILEFTHGQAALEYLTAHCLGEQASEDCPDWIILDLNLPIMDGVELLAQLEALEQHELIKQAITILTSSTSPQDVQKAADLGVKAYLTKPLLSDGVLQLLQTFFTQKGHS